MKRFLGTFVVCLVVIFGFLLFGGSLILDSSWGILVFWALVLTVLILLFEGQDRRIEELQARVQALEEALEQKEETT